MFEKAQASLRTGHFIGLSWLSTTLTPLILKFFSFDDDSIWMKLSKINIPIAVLGGIGTLAVTSFSKNDIIEGAKNFIDNFAQRFRFTKDKKVTNISKGVDASELYKPLGKLVLDDGVMAKIQSLIAGSALHGGSLHAIGPPGNGKTSLGYGIVSSMVEEDKGDKLPAVQLWLVDKNVMEGTLADRDELGMFTKMLDSISLALGFGKMSGNTITERAEIIAAHAVAHYRMTGEPVVILFDEAHEIFKQKEGNSIKDLLENRKELSTITTSTVDPNKRSKTIKEFGALLEDKIKKAMCKGIMFLATSNISRSEITAHMFRRIQTTTLTAPGRKDRIKRLRQIVERWFTEPSLDGCLSKLKTNGITLEAIQSRLTKLEDPDQSLINTEMHSLAEKLNIYDIGTVNLIDVYFNADEEAAKKQGFIDSISDMKNRDVLCHEHFDFAVRDAVYNFNSGNVDDFLKLIQKYLVNYTEETLQAKDTVLADVKYYKKVKLNKEQIQGINGQNTKELSNHPELDKFFNNWLGEKLGPLVDLFLNVFQGVLKGPLQRIADDLLPPVIGDNSEQVNK